MAEEAPGKGAGNRQALPAGVCPPHKAASGGTPCVCWLSRVLGSGPTPLLHLSALGREGALALQEMARRVTMSLCVHFHTQVFTKPGLGVRSAVVSPVCVGAPGPSPRCPLLEGRPDTARLSETRFLALNLPICGLLLGRILT